MTLQFSFTHQFDSQSFAITGELPEKGVTAVFGRSGSGKSTLLNVLSGLLIPDCGEITFNQRLILDTKKDHHLPVWKRKVAMVFQDARLFPHLTIKKNLLFGAPKQSTSIRFNELCSLLGIEHLLDAKPNTLSGGEKQRVAIARALLSEPELLLMDEPLASLDLPRKREVIRYLNQLSNNIDIPIVYVTHSLEEVMHLADHLLVLESGKVVDFGSVEEVWNGQSLALWQEGERYSTLLSATVAERHAKYAMREMSVAGHCFWVPDQGLCEKVSSNMRIRIDAQDVSVTLSPSEQSSIRNVIPVTISEISRLNEHSNLLTLNLGNELLLKSILTQWATQELDLEVGKKVYAQVKGVSFTQQNLAQY
ncbi:molybdenum ABC transporter ATP-binding protein [Vibrio sp. UCD-FRSSP16_10]|uniref:molybdenum ABC transporter ATP-binding protein ModC n=1 Tax=unclassified Vibrio TaxID=2614977 RepID=UPI0007FE6B9C|nr:MULTISPECIES: molybdenum ABC transporter ATP-binding protein ModC [unclassified Vibrio]OBT07974.1 molybdenum ABC transporter ATP-binding protein [Vibrio sp. UCD-FRSSP16_30]OBT17149.1 molybdenum ABC transporter ATP-binding protein [Vibrio sp. UCD-FRSSP16_10]